jgi:PAS domain S-box-containing protein
VNVTVRNRELAAAIADITGQVLDVRSGGPATAAPALERLRQRTRAAAAAVWVITGGHVQCALRVGRMVTNAAAPLAEVADATTAIEHLRRSTTIFRRAGELSGIEQLVPEGVQSLVAATSTRQDGVTGVLVFGWDDAEPAIDERASDHLRVAAALFTSVLPVSAPQPERHLDDAMLRSFDSVPVPLWIVEPDGRLIYGNDAWLQATGGRVHAGVLWTDASHPDDRESATAAFHSAAARHGAFATELRLEAADGAYRWWSFVGAPRYAANGDLDSYAGICIDGSAGRHADQTLRQLRAKLVVAQEVERSRIARELHDDIGQQVTLLATRLDAVLDTGKRSRSATAGGLEEVRQGLQELASSIHNLSHELHPAKLKLLGLEPTLAALCRDVSAKSAVRIRFSADSIPSDVPDDSALCVFRVTQEALQNAVKHSGARAVEVRVTGTPSQLQLHIADDGGGFDPLAPHPIGIGLLTIRERIELMGGQSRIDTAPGRGTTIEATVPLTHGAGRGA